MSLLFLLLEFLVVSAVLLGAARLGTTAVVTVVAALQFFQALMGATLCWPVGPELATSLACGLFFSGNLAIFLYMYAKVGTSAARSVLYAMAGANLVVVALSLLITSRGWLLGEDDPLGIPPEVVEQTLASSSIGLIALGFALVLTLILYNQMRRGGAPIIVAYPAALTVALAFDAVVFVVPAFHSAPEFESILTAAVVGQGLSGLAYGMSWGSLLQLRGDQKFGSLADLFQRLTYRDEGGLQALISGHLESHEHDEQEFTGWFSQLPDPVCVVVDGVVEIANRSFADVLAFESVSDVAGTRVEDLFEPKAADRLDDSGERKVVVKHHLYNGRVVDVTSTPLQFRGRSARILVMHDVSEREELKEHMTHADRLASVGALAAGVAHEVNNPLTFVTANQGMAIEMLNSIRDEVDEEHQIVIDETIESLEDATHGAGRVKKVVSQLMTLARADTNDVELCNLNAILDANISMARAHLSGRAELVLNVESLPPLEANASLMGQVLLNLLLNAAQAVEQIDRAEGHEIEVSARSTDSEVLISIRDTGPGIPEDIRDEIMAPFFTTKPVGEGTGLGLPTTKSIVESLGGRIEFESEVGVGTTFEVRLPIESSIHRALSVAARSSTLH